MKRIPRQSAHYAPYSGTYGRERILPPDLNPTKLWKQWCLEQDPDFHEQAKRLKFWRSFDRKRQWPVYPYPEMREDEMLLKPKLAHTTYFKRFKEYDLRFGQP